MSVIDGSTSFRPCAQALALLVYSVASRLPTCQGPHTVPSAFPRGFGRDGLLSLPSPQYLTLCGSSRPVFFRRSFAQLNAQTSPLMTTHWLSPVPLQYSTHASASSNDPVPTVSRISPNVPIERMQHETYCSDI